MKPVIILGSTGSIGTQAIDVCNTNNIPVAGLAAGGHNLELLARQALQSAAPVIAIARDDAAGEFWQAFDAIAPRGMPRPQVITGGDAVAKLAGSASDEITVLNGITGAVGLDATLAALDSGATLALANKESLVIGGPLIADHMVRPAQIIPVDSEHSAIFQCLAAGGHHRGLCHETIDGTTEVASLVLTASGGPFRGKTRAELTDVTPGEALDHPTWQMGPVVTINSATLMNKALEFIEAVVLFDIAPEAIDVVIHPQSIVHSMVTFRDGATIAQASPPDMRLPIAVALTYPHRLPATQPCTWERPTSWDFMPIDEDTFPALRLARQALAASPIHPAVLNAANEVAVAAFLAQRCSFLSIVDTVATVVETYRGPNTHEITRADLAAADAWARQYAAELLA
ncbi:MAG: 1-deoxy-D-xylulose-5-phosphate reductoisomerase [Bowdeniella nasicola]|nr:1-deoxy-D-xylulose-5-phosphate reductoisomerase [Bowdeniella nasicola]